MKLRGPSIHFFHRMILDVLHSSVSTYAAHSTQNVYLMSSDGLTDTRSKGELRPDSSLRLAPSSTTCSHTGIQYCEVINRRYMYD
nr:hypothetical protein CFP56_59691 [Quercus suber]